MTVGDRIKEARKRAGYTLEELSNLVELSRQTLSRYETGVITNIPYDKIELIADKLETTPAYLMGWDARTDFGSEEFISKLDVPADFPGTREEYASYLFDRSLYADLKQEAEERQKDDNDIRFIARKMQNANPEQKEMLMRMIKAAFADDEDE